MGSHAIGTGLMSHQRSHSMEWAGQAMPTGMRRAAALQRSRLGGSAPANARRPLPDLVAKKEDQIVSATARRLALALATRISCSETPSVPVDTTLLASADGAPTVLRTRLFWQTPQLRDEAIIALGETLGLEGDGRWPQPPLSDEDFARATPENPVVLTWNTNELTVVLRCVPLSATSESSPGLGEGLASTLKARPRGRALADAIHRRRTATTQFVSADPGHTEGPSWRSWRLIAARTSCSAGTTRSMPYGWAALTLA